MAAQWAGTALMALAIGMTAATVALIPAMILIRAIAALQLGGSRFGQKSGAADLIKAGHVGAPGAVMFLMRGLL